MQKSKIYRKQIYLTRNVFYSPVGFTLIELLVIIAIMGILAVLGIASFVSYSQKQTLDTATKEVVEMLSAAKSRTQSQVKPTSVTACNATPGDSTLHGYAVNIDKTAHSYVLHAFCGPDDKTCANSNSSNIVGGDTSKIFPKNISFGSDTCIFFETLTGKATCPGGGSSCSITITNDASTKNIIIDSGGNINVN